MLLNKKRVDLQAINGRTLKNSDKYAAKSDQIKAKESIEPY